MNVEQLTVMQLNCAMAWAEEKEKPGAFDRVFSDFREVLVEAKLNTEIATDPKCVEIIHWFERLTQTVKEQRLHRDLVRRIEEARRLRRIKKRDYPKRMMQGGSCSGN
jgi:hypothetical protein